MVVKNSLYISPGFPPFLYKIVFMTIFFVILLCYLKNLLYICFIIILILMDCIFCKIIAWAIPGVKFWENTQFIALLDAFPACRWQTLILPKQHYDSDIFIMDDSMYSALMLATKEVADLLKKWLWVEKIGMVVEWLQVPHAHVKLYPFRWWKSFEWWLTGHVLADINELQKLADSL